MDKRQHRDYKDIIPTIYFNGMKKGIPYSIGLFNLISSLQAHKSNQTGGRSGMDFTDDADST